MRIHNSIKILVDIGVWDDFVNAMKLQHESQSHQKKIREMTNSNIRAESIISGYVYWRYTSQGYHFWAEKIQIAKIAREKILSNES